MFQKKKMAKKGRKKVKKSQKKTPEEAKSEVVEILVAKCGKEREEVLEAWDQFHEQFPGGLIPKEDFLASKKVNCCFQDSILFFIGLFNQIWKIKKFFFTEQDACRVSLQSL